MSLSLWLWKERSEPESEVIRPNSSYKNMSVFAHLSLIRITTIRKIILELKKKSFGNFLHVDTPSNWEKISKYEARNISSCKTHNNLKIFCPSKRHYENFKFLTQTSPHDVFKTCDVQFTQCWRSRLTVYCNSITNCFFVHCFHLMTDNS
jgi:hypothetical protein